MLTKKRTETYETSCFWVGTLPGSPVANIHVGTLAHQPAVSFQHHTNKPLAYVKSSDEETTRKFQFGDFVHLTVEQKAGLLDHVQRMWLRATYKTDARRDEDSGDVIPGTQMFDALQAEMKNEDDRWVVNPRAMPLRPSDEPVAKWLFLVPCRKADIQPETYPPASMLDTYPRELGVEEPRAKKTGTRQPAAL